MHPSYRKTSLYQILEQYNGKGATGLLTNQGGYSIDESSYLFELLSREKFLKRLFLPEHGLFAELQDQIPLTATEVYSFLKPDYEIVSLYGDSEESLVPDQRLLADLNTIVVDIQDVGSRYYTFATTVSYLVDVLVRSQKDVALIIIDRPNPAGRQVEGSSLPEEYASFVGHPGLPHRHGLTMGELAWFYHRKADAKFPLVIIPVGGMEAREINDRWVRVVNDKKYRDSVGESGGIDVPGSGQLRSVSPWNIAPSPNMPSPYTPLVYSGQCLFEGTNLSEGRGTTRPFEIFGAPWMKRIFEGKRDMAPLSVEGAILRPLKFIPTFHKYRDEVCFGYQIHLTGKPYHSLIHTLQILRELRFAYPKDFQWRDGPYEFRSDRPAIELLAGDRIILDYLDGQSDLHHLLEHLRSKEQQWIQETEDFLIYNDGLFSIS